MANRLNPRYRGGAIHAHQSLPLSRFWLETGRLLALIPPVDLPMKNYFVFPSSSTKREHLLTVYRWIKARFAAVAQPLAC